MQRNIIILNKSTVLTDAQVQSCVKNLQIQVTRDFAPWWSQTCVLSFAKTASPKVEQIVITDTADVAGALGYHDVKSGVPIGFVFAKTTLDNGDAWQSTLSHELLEQLVDPFCDFASLGYYKSKPAIYALEMCDAVENGEYKINGDPLSNFILPAWFNAQPQGPTDFLGVLKGKPFALDKGGYTAYCTKLGQWQQAFAKNTPAHQKKFVFLERRGRRWNRLFTKGSVE